MSQEKQAISERGELWGGAILSLRVAALVCLAALCWHLTGLHFLLNILAFMLLAAVSIYAFSGAVLLAAMLRNILGRRPFIPDNRWVLTILGIVILFCVLSVYTAEFILLTRSTG